MTSTNTLSPVAPFSTCHRGDLLRLFGADREKTIDYILSANRHVLIPIGVVGHTRVYPASIIPIVRKLLKKIDARQRVAVTE